MSKALTEYIETVGEHDPATALQIATTELAAMEAQADMDRIAARENAMVTFSPEGRLLTANLGGIQRLASMYAGSTLVPDHFRKQIANCAIAVQFALRSGTDPMTIMQGMYIVHGKPGLESKLAIALLNASGAIKGRMDFKLDAKVSKCEAFVTDAQTGKTYSQTVTLAMAEAEKWTKNTKWSTMTALMLQYRSAMFLIRMYYPEVLFGMQTAEELSDIKAAETFTAGDTVAAQGSTLSTLLDEPSPEAEPEPEPEYDKAGAELPGF
jgi:hypothetical protein